MTRTASLGSGPRLRRVARSLADVLCVAVAVGALAVLVPGFFGVHRYVITGGSMSGTFEPGAIVFEREIPVEDLRVGDVITYQPPADTGVRSLVTHRIASIQRDTEHGPLFTTRGDANPSADPWQFQIDAHTQPRMVLAVDHLGWPLIWLADPAHRLALIGAPAGVIFLLAARELVSTLRRPPSRTANEVVEA